VTLHGYHISRESTDRSWAHGRGREPGAEGQTRNRDRPQRRNWERKEQLVKGSTEDWDAGESTPQRLHTVEPLHRRRLRCISDLVSQGYPPTSLIVWHNATRASAGSKKYFIILRGSRPFCLVAGCGWTQNRAGRAAYRNHAILYPFCGDRDSKPMIPGRSLL